MFKLITSIILWQGLNIPRVNGERFTLQLIKILGALHHLAVEEFYQIGCDATFSSDTHTAKPSGVLLYYNYGAAAVKWWGHNTNILLF